MFDAISFLFGAYYAYVSLARDDLLAVRNHFPWKNCVTNRISKLAISCICISVVAHISEQIFWSGTRTDRGYLMDIHQ